MGKARKAATSRKMVRARKVVKARKAVTLRKMARARKAATSRIGRRPSTKRTQRVGTRQRERTHSTNLVVSSRPGKAEGTRILNKPSSFDAIKHPKILTKSYEMFRTWIALYVCASTARF